MRNPYEVLGVSRTANAAEIKKAFRTLAKKYHPDAQGSDPSKAKLFQEVNAAYEIVGDKDKRAKYDRGEIDASGQPKGFDPRAHGFRGGRAGGPGDFEFRWQGGESGVNAEDILADLFGGLGGGGRRRRSHPQKGPDAQLATTISLEEAARGGTRRVVLADGKQIEARIPAGVKDGQVIRLRGQGGAGERGGPPGDLLITVGIAPHHQFTREGRDLKMDLPVSLKEAMLGAKIEVPTLSGPVTLTVPVHSNSGRVLRLKGKGLPAAGGQAAGDLYVRLAVTLPDEPDPALDAFLKGWNNPYDPRAKRRQGG